MRYLKYIGFLLFVVAILVLNGCGGGGEQENQQTLTMPIAVEVAPIESGDIELRKTYGGNVEGIEQSDVYARIPETVEEVKVKLGQKVNAGEVLVILDKTGPNSRYVQSKAAYENARKDYERMKYLYEEKAVAEQAYDQAFTAYKVAEADYNSAAALVNLKSPIDGVITAISVTIGQQAVVGKPLVTVARTDSLLIRFMVGENDARKIKIGSSAKIIIGDEGGRVIMGKVVRVADSADPGTRGFEVEVETANQNNWLKPGTYVKVGLVLEEYDDVLLAPTKAILLKEGTSYVFKYDQGHAARVTIETGGSSEGKTIVLSGLEQGDRIVTEGNNLVVEGDSLKVIESSR
ncbi:MAG: efflux RND transporter periplasmic adaptor subunit [candidate division Zixibacteria bacterium]|nr:efflux RND transporter periplasmic adaptor subunit [candidate division Zixibacteria bacterium]